jgi:hypothetical protein
MGKYKMPDEPHDLYRKLEPISRVLRALGVPPPESLIPTPADVLKALGVPSTDTGRTDGRRQGRPDQTGATREEMNPAYTPSRIAQIDKKIKQMEDEIRDLKKDRVRLKNESAKSGKKT